MSAVRYGCVKATLFGHFVTAELLARFEASWRRQLGCADCETAPARLCRAHRDEARDLLRELTGGEPPLDTALKASLSLMRG